MTGKGAAAYAYDPLDRLTQVVDGATVQFTYNGDGVRLVELPTERRPPTCRICSRHSPVVLTETTGGRKRAYLYGMDLLAQIDPQEIRPCHADGLEHRAVGCRGPAHGWSTLFDVFGGAKPCGKRSTAVYVRR